MEAHNVPVRPSSDGGSHNEARLVSEEYTSDRQRNHSVLYPSSALSSSCYV